jgi:hypothetical protein
MQNPLANLIHGMSSYGLEWTSRRFYAKYMGTVTDTVDPQGQGRIRVTSRIVSGNSYAFANWALPTTPYAGQDKGIYFPPDEGDKVWVWFDQGDPTQPKYSGAYWCNPGGNVKTRESSHVPSEFKNGDGAPTTRGIKTKRGHGILFEDDPDTARVEWWTGVQETAGEPATRHHEFVMSDEPGAEAVGVYTNVGHKTEWIDIDGQLGIKTETNGGYYCRLLETEKRAEMGTANGFFLKIDEGSGSITIQTQAGGKVELLDSGQAVVITDQTGDTITMSPTGIVVNSKTNVSVTSTLASTFQSTLATAISSGAALSLQSVGALTLTAGALFKMLATGTAQVSSPNAVLLGEDGGTFRELIDARFAQLYNEHEHPSPAGGNTGKPVDLLIIGDQTTTKTKAN